MSRPAVRLAHLVQRALEDPAGFRALEDWVDESRGRYRKPPLSPDSADRTTLDAFVDEYSDWQVRIHDLNRILQELRPDGPDGDSVERARVVQVLAGLSESPEQRGRAAFRLGFAFRRVDRFFDAADAFREAVHYFRDAESKRSEIDALSYLTDCLRDDKQFDATIAAAEELVTSGRVNGLGGHEASGLRDLGLAHAALGRATEALDALRQALAVRRTVDAAEAHEQFVGDLGAFLNALGTTARTFGRYDEAVRAFLECAEIHRDAGDDSQRALALSEIGYTYLENRDFDKARQFLDQAVRVAEREGPTPRSTRWKLQLGTLGRQLDPTSAAEPIPHAVIDLDPKHGDGTQAYLIAEMAIRALGDDDPQRARLLGEQALAWADIHADRGLQVTCLNVLGPAYARLDRRQDGVAALQRGVQIADRGGGSVAAAVHLRYNLATLFLNEGHTALAADVLTAGIANTELLLSRTESFASRQQVAAGSLGLYELSALIASHRDAAPNHQHLLAFAEGVRARNMAAWAASEARVEAAGLEPVAAARVRDDLRALRSAEVELDARHLTSTLTLDRANVLMGETRRLQSAIDVAVGSTSAHVWNPSEALHEALPHVVAPGAALVSLFCVPEGVCPVVVSTVDGEIVTAGELIRWPRSERVPAIAEWTGTAAWLRTRTMRPRGRTRLAADDDQSDFAAREACDRLRALVGDRLLSPLAELVLQFEPSRLVVIPHRELAMLPFWDLLDSVPSVGALTLAPSLNMFRICRARARETAGLALVVDDVSRTLALAPVEADSLRQHRGGRIESVGTVEDLLRRASECRLLHAAAHGLFKPANPYHSGILVGAGESVTGLLVQYVDITWTADQPVFTLSGTPNAQSYRLLTAGECMSRLSLNSCRLVLLSSCEVGLADPHGGGELTSVPTSLLVSGAKSVIAAMWPVDDGAATVLMDRFYRRWNGGAGEEPSPAAALAGARQELRQLDRSAVEAVLGADAWIPDGDQPYAHPLYADAFQCFGDW